MELFAVIVFLIFVVAASLVALAALFGIGKEPEKPDGRTIEKETNQKLERGQEEELDVSRRKHSFTTHVAGVTLRIRSTIFDRHAALLGASWTGNLDQLILKDDIYFVPVGNLGDSHIAH